MCETSLHTFGIFQIDMKFLFILLVGLISTSIAKEESKDKQDVGTVIGIDLGMLMC